ncbi:MAG: acetylornithine deacetylase, partial [Ktedonobacteraceae bacterium]
MNEITDLLQQLVAIDSINPDLVPGGAGEERIARFIAEWFSNAGLEVVWEEPVPGRPNVIGIARGSGGGQTLLLNAHMDT